MIHRDLLPDVLLRAELAQRKLEGCQLGDLPERIEIAVAAGNIEAQAEVFWSELEAMEGPSDARADPLARGAVRDLRRASSRRQADSEVPREAGLYDRIYGAWLGRCAGCTLGKPVEGWPRARIREYLYAARAYPLASYFPVLDPFPEGLALQDNYTRTTMGNVKGMVRDDDIDYTVLGLHILETCGRDFSSSDVAAAWLRHLPFGMVYSAEAVAYRNLVNGVQAHNAGGYRNPYRHWIGGQIRADMWGYVNPGRPDRAAAMAYRDASLSHRGEGIYGGMWAAACIAAAFCEDNPLAIIKSGLAEIPDDSHIAEAVRDTIEWTHLCTSWEDGWERVDAKYGHYHPVHVLNNSCAIVLGLLYGEGDLGKSICIAVMSGWDTDCTGATVGSMFGASRGAHALPEKWILPLEDRLESIVPGFSDSHISDLARRTAALVGRS